ncbi:Heterokaryon incompatibility protein (HET) domain containing protein [Rhypophila sp. PSN 637]
MDASYIYEGLPEAGQIRLLKLQPGTDDSPIHFTLVTANLHENPEYEAISYCWGDPSNPKTVYCDGKTIQVTRSLYTALRRLRKSDQVCTLWADAVCINQKDYVEKGQQVNLMTRIYSQPTAVLIWLGNDKTGLDGLKECLEGALEVLPPDSEDPEFLLATVLKMHMEAAQLREQGKPNFNDHNWAPMNHLLCSPWFDRRWIIQEVAMAPDDVPRRALCGDDIEFDWQDLASICYRIGSYGLIYSIAGLSAINPSSPSMASFFLSQGRPVKSSTLSYLARLIKKYHDRPYTNLIDLVTATTMFQCTEPKDHLYSLLNITPRNSDLVADYSVSMEEACLRFATSVLRKDRNLRLLSLAPHTFVQADAVSIQVKMPARLDLPSWVPDLALQGPVNPLVSYTIRQQVFHAGQKEDPEEEEEAKIEISPDNKLLHLRGKIVDKISALTRTNVDVPYPMDQPTWHKMVIGKQRDWFGECQSVAAPTPDLQAKLQTDQEFKDEFARAILHGMTMMRDPVPRAILPVVHAYMDYLSEVLAKPENQIAGETKDLMLTYGPLIEGSMASVGEARRFCRTEGGRLGQVRKEARVGDLVCIILGAEVPYVIRPLTTETDNDEVFYELVGDCYVNGVMQGEALRDGRYETVDIVLA